MDTPANAQQPTSQPAGDDRSQALSDGDLVQRADHLITNWRNTEQIYLDARDARELDITVEEARSRNIVAGNETYIGRRIIDANINTEKPVFIQYIGGSNRHVSLTDPTGQAPVDALANLEQLFTNYFRVGSWEEIHQQGVDSMQLHGRGILFAIADIPSELGAKFTYLAIEDFVFPTELRSLQTSNMLAVRFKITADQFDAWQQSYGFNPAVAQQIKSKYSTTELVSRMFEVFQIFTRINGVVHAHWYSAEAKELLTKPTMYVSGEFDAMGQPVPSAAYPFFPLYYRITENVQIIERKGRAHADMHDQEAMTALTTNYVNATLRASELYISTKNLDPSGNPEVTQSEILLDHGKVCKQPVDFISPPWPDASGLTTLQALRTENAAAAGAVDYAASNRKDSRKTAKEMSMAEEQADKAKSLPLATFALSYKVALEYIFGLWMRNNISGYKSNIPPDQRFKDLIVNPAGSIDYIERGEKLNRLNQALQLFGNTPVAAQIQREIIQLAFPKEAAKWIPLLEDPTKQLLGSALQLLSSLPEAAVPPAQQGQLQQFLQQAQPYAANNA